MAFPFSYFFVQILVASLLFHIMPYLPQNWERASNFSSTEICWMKPLSRGKTNLGTWKQILIHPAGLFIPHQHLLS